MKIKEKMKIMKQTIYNMKIMNTLKTCTMSKITIKALVTGTIEKYIDNRSNIYAKIFLIGRYKNKNIHYTKW